MNVLDLFAGIGGFSLGLERAGMRTIAFCEIDPFCRKVLRKHWPDVPIYEDVRGLRYDGPVDVITGGFPCQPFSTASHGRRVAADLWPEMFRIIGDIRPRYVIAENVQELPLRRAAYQLALLGYKGRPRRIGGDDIGADSKRHRWWLCAHTDDESEFHRALDAEMALMPAVRQGVWGWQNYARAIRVSDGISHRMERNRALGNAVVPQVVEMIGQAIMEAGS